MLQMKFFSFALTKIKMFRPTIQFYGIEACAINSTVISIHSE